MAAGPSRRPLTYQLAAHRSQVVTVDEILARYGISVERHNGFLYELKRQGVLDYHSMGPSEAAAMRWPDVVVAEFHAADEYVLHEGCHLIVAPSLEAHENPVEGQRMSREEDGLLQLERALARRLPPKLRKRVIDYQSITSIDAECPPGARRSGYAEVGDWKRPTRTSWWEEGLKIAIEMGFLSAAGEPTWCRHPEFRR